MERQAALARIEFAFERHRILLESDRKFPSVVGLIAGDFRGSWWAHPQARFIFSVASQFASSKDVLSTKLVSGKTTFIHRSLWKDVVSIGQAKEEWQLSGLPIAARSLLSFVEEKGGTTTIEAGSVLGASQSKAALELERRLLVQSSQFHSAAGFHAKKLRSWRDWWSAVRPRPQLPERDGAKAELALRVREINREHGARAKLPWEVAAGDSGFLAEE